MGPLSSVTPCGCYNVAELDGSGFCDMELR